MDKQKAVRKEKEGAFVDLLNREMRELQDSMKQKQIEEMAKLEIEESEGFYSAFINDMRISKNKPLGKSKTFKTFMCPKKYILQAIGIHENAVVLTDEEYERWQGQTLNIKKVRKETANEIWDDCINKIMRGCGDDKEFWVIEILIDTFKKYGVEVENDLH